MMQMAEGRTVLITGGTSGIGNALVRRFVAGQWNVVTCGRNAGAVNSLQSEFGSSHFLGIAADLRLENNVAAVIEGSTGKFGRLDACVLNAGTLGPSPLPAVKDTILMDMRKTFETNLFANFNVMQRALEVMKSPGVIVHITSDAAVHPYPGWGIYGSSKAAMKHLVETLGAESAGTGLKALNYDPGDVDTAMHALAVPDADKSTLRRPAEVAEELFGLITAELG